MNGGDQLARGMKSAQFPASDGKVSQDKWDAAFADDVTDTPPQTRFEWPHESSEEPHNNS